MTRTYTNDCRLVWRLTTDPTKATDVLLDKYHAKDYPPGTQITIRRTVEVDVVPPRRGRVA